MNCILFLKPKRWLAGIFVLSLTVSGLRAQTYDLSQAVVAGGGGSSSGGAFQLVGTIGQPVAGAAVGGSFVLEGGLWGGAFLVQTPGAPKLSLAAVGNNLVLSWSDQPAGYSLEQTTALGRTASWLPGSYQMTTNGGVIRVTLPPPIGNKFFRLRRNT